MKFGRDRRRELPPRVLVLNWRDPWHPEGGGSELYVHQVVRRLIERGNQVTVFAASYDDAPPREIRDQVHYRRRGGHLTVYLWAALYLLTRRFGRIDRVLEVHNGMPFMSTVFTRAPVTMLVHHVHREQWPVVGPVLARVGWFMESRAAVWANRKNKYVAVSEVTRSELVALGVPARNIAIAYNGMPPIPERGHVAKCAEPRLAVLSRLVPHKQIEHAIEMMPRILDRYPEATLHVLGSGWWHDNLSELVDALGLDENVFLHGHVSEDEKFTELERAWVHVLPSVKEGWGLSIIEAASVGTPSVAYRSAGGVQESILDGVTGLLAADQDELTTHVLTVLDDHEYRWDLGHKAKERSSHFNWEATTDQVSAQLNVR